MRAAVQRPQAGRDGGEPAGHDHPATSLRTIWFCPYPTGPRAHRAGQIASQQRRGHTGVLQRGFNVFEKPGIERAAWEAWAGGEVPYSASPAVSSGRRSVPVAPIDSNLYVACHRGAELWSEGCPDFPPPSLRPTPGRAGQGGTGGDPELRLKLSTGRLRTSRA